MKFYTTSKISENIHETPEKFLVCMGVSIARTGEMIYMEGETPLEVGPDGKAVVDRTAKEVFRPETIASFEGKAVTIQHPDEFVSPENWTDLAKGILQNVRKGIGEQENDLVADLLITDSAAIELVKRGLREVSCGYEAGYTQTGIGRGFQTEIIGNHLALVQEGRAGASYAINDHKGKGSEMTLKERIEAMFTKTKDDALKIIAETKDMGAPAATEGKSGFVSMDDMKGYFDSKFSEMMGKKEEKKADDASTQPTQSSAAEVVAKDEEGGEASLEERLKKLEAMMAGMMDKKTGDADEDVEEEVADEEGDDEDEEMEDEAACTGDSASRVEILAPGMKPGKNFKAEALLKAYATKDGKAVIERFTGGKAPNMKDEAWVSATFVGASEVLKQIRSEALAGTRTHAVGDSKKSGAKTAEEINEINAKYWANRK